MRVFLLISIVFFSLASQAAPSTSTNSTTNSFVKIKIASLQLFSSFSAFIYFQGDERNRVRLQKAKQQGNQAITLLPSSEIAVRNKWKQVIKYVDLYEDHNFDGIDMSLEASWSIHRKEFNKIIDPLISDDLAIIDDLQLNLESILSQYLGYANSTTGGYGVSFGETPLENKIEVVSQELERLVQADKKYQPLQKKWRYIKGTLAAYNSNVAPFVVLHTFENMREIIASY